MEVFFEISTIFGIAALVALFMHALRQPLILGYLITGVLVGPAALNLLHATDVLQLFAELGNVSLLFIIGLGLSPHLVREVGKTSFLAGMAQVIGTTIPGYLIGRALGFAAAPALYLGLAFAFASTMIISKILTDKREISSLHGKLSIGFLLVQDLVAVFTLVVITVGAKGENIGGAVSLTLLKLGLLLMLVAGLAKSVLPWIAKTFARSQELLLLFTVAWGMGMATLFHTFGISSAIGALAAGLALAASPFHFEIASKMKMLRDFFIVIFFVLLGAQLSLGSVTELWVPALVYSLFILIGNPLIVMLILWPLGFHRKTSFIAGLTMAQISEFSLLLLMLAKNYGYIGSEHVTLATLVGIITIPVSTLMLLHADRLYGALAPALKLFEKRGVKAAAAKKERYEVILFGCHRVGADFIHTLRVAKKEFLVVDFDPQVVHALEATNVPVRYGDADDEAFLEELPLKHTKAIISTLPDFDVNLSLLERLRTMNPNAVIMTVAQTLEEAMALYEAGAAYVILPHFLGGNYASLLLGKYGYSKGSYGRERLAHICYLKSRIESASSAPR